MTTDAKQSLIAFAAVTSIFAFGYVFIQLMRGVHFPKWVPLAGLAIQTVNLAWMVIRRVRAKKATSIVR